VGFFDEKCRRYVTVARKDTTLLNRLEKTKQERQPNFKAEKEVRCIAGGNRREQRCTVGTEVRCKWQPNFDADVRCSVVLGRKLYHPFDTGWITRQGVRELFCGHSTRVLAAVALCCECQARVSVSEVSLPQA
jgi:hypothetical protein